MQQLAHRNLRAQSPWVRGSVEAYGWAIGDQWPTESYGLVLASDIIYGAHHSMRTCPNELRRFVALLDHCVAQPDGVALIGHVERNSLAQADLCAALEHHFVVRVLKAEECVSADLFGQRNNVGVRGSVVVLCVRRADDATVADLTARAPEVPRPPPLHPPPPPESARGAPTATDQRVACACELDAHRLRMIEESILNGRAPYNARVLLKHELRPYYDDDQARWAALRPNLCVVMYDVPRHGMTTLEKNAFYTPDSHRRMSEDVVRTSTYRAAIARALASMPPETRVLDIGSGPFMLLGRIAHHCGARFVACVEHAAESTELSTELLRSECATYDWRTRPQEAREEGGGARGAQRGSDDVDGRTSSSRAMHLAARRLREIDEYRQLMRRLALQLSPVRLSFCAVSSAAAPNDLSDEQRRRALAADGRTRPLMQVVTAAHDDARRGAPRARSQTSSTRILELYHGLSSEMVLPAGIDLLLHEILGNVASAEGAIHAINELRGRNGLAGRACRVLPRAAGTLLAPAGPLAPSVLERLLMFQRTGHWEARPGRMYAVRGFPSELLLAAAQPLEWLDFSASLPYVSTRVCRFVCERAGSFDGLHLHLRVELDEHATIDAYRERTTWTCTYVRLLAADRALWLPEGALIECTCTVDASTHCPSYSIDVRVSRDGSAPTEHVADFSWRGDG